LTARLILPHFLRNANHQNLRDSQRICEPRITRIARIISFPIRAYQCNPWFDRFCLVAALPRCALGGEDCGLALVGGKAAYSRQPKLVKEIIRGQKDSLILERFSSAGDIQRHLETLEWS
jgi:hypothetical protein